MADEEGEVVQSGEGETVMNALKEVLKKSLIHDGLARGLYQSVKALDKRQAHLCVLSSSCTEPAYTRLVKALCAEHNIHLITVKDSKTLGEWVGLCKLDKEAKPRKIVGCTCCVVKDFGEESESLNVLMDYLKKRGQ